MSRNEFEEGTLKFPKAEFKKFKDSFISEYLRQAQLEIDAINKEIDVFLLAMKGKRGVNWPEALENHLYSKKLLELENVFANSFYALKWHLFEEKPLAEGARSWQKEVVNKKPKKLKPLKIKAREKVITFHNSDFNLQLDNEKAELTWSVYENNHAVEHARSSKIGVLLFKLLKTVQWGRGGGCFWGNDEYNRESSGPGAGANYVTATFGSVKKNSFY